MRSTRTSRRSGTCPSSPCRNPPGRWRAAPRRCQRNEIGELLLTPASYLVTVTRTAGQGPARFRLELGWSRFRTFFQSCRRTTVRLTRRGRSAEPARLPCSGCRPAGHLELKSPAIVAAHGLVFGRQRPVRDDMLASPRKPFLAPAAGTTTSALTRDTDLATTPWTLGLPSRPRRLPEMGVVARETSRARFSIGATGARDAHLISFVLVSLSDQDLDLEAIGTTRTATSCHWRSSSMDPKVETVRMVRSRGRRDSGHRIQFRHPVDRVPAGSCAPRRWTAADRRPPPDGHPEPMTAMLEDKRTGLQVAFVDAVVESGRDSSGPPRRCRRICRSGTAAGPPPCGSTPSGTGATAAGLPGGELHQLREPDAGSNSSVAGVREDAHGLQLQRFGRPGSAAGP